MTKVSVVVPCRNEEDTIMDCLNSVLKSSHKDLEIIVVDGMSTDHTIKRIDDEAYWCEGFCTSVDGEVNYYVLRNFGKTTQHALNKGTKAARGDYVLELSAHSSIPPDYIEKCLRVAEANMGSCTGGTYITVTNNSLLSRAVAIAMKDPFGVGKAKHKQIVDSVREVDTVFGILRPRKIFDEVGYFNPKLVHSQDLELNARIKAAGHKILQVPGAFIYYYVQPGFFRFLKKAFINGVWAILPRKLCETRFLTMRHFVPLLFVLTLPISIWPYIVLNLFRSFQMSRKEGLPFLFLMPFIFFLWHFVYGLGSVWGLVKVLWWEAKDADTRSAGEA